ncbi:MAG: hypothetical protein CMP34_04360 [Rickettsiales bacterium]|nr:hypothetical protein [Rickettsiales bacterium]
MKKFDPRLLELIVCPRTGQKLFYKKNRNILSTIDNKNVYKIIDGVPILKKN